MAGEAFRLFYSMRCKALGRTSGPELSSPSLTATRYRGL